MMRLGPRYCREAVASASYARQTNQSAEAVEKVKAGNPDAVVVVGPSNTVAPILKQAHAKGWKPLFVTVSFVRTDELIQEAGADAEGMVITQVVPPYYLTDLKTVALYRRTLEKFDTGLEAELREPGRLRGCDAPGGGD